MIGIYKSEGTKEEPPYFLTLDTRRHCDRHHTRVFIYSRTVGLWWASAHPSATPLHMNIECFKTLQHNLLFTLIVAIFSWPLFHNNKITSQLLILLLINRKCSCYNVLNLFKLYRHIVYFCFAFCI